MKAGKSTVLRRITDKEHHLGQIQSNEDQQRLYKSICCIFILYIYFIVKIPAFLKLAHIIAGVMMTPDKLKNLHIHSEEIHRLAKRCFQN